MSDMPLNSKWEKTGKTIGGGGQGQIFVVKPSDSNQYKDETYTLKQLRNIDSSQAIERFKIEIEAIRKIDDERVVKIVDYSVDDPDYLYYVMPNYSENDYLPLHKICFEKTSPFINNPTLSLEFIKECVLAVRECHMNDIIHRDLKPQNILYNTKTQKPLILDFGCSQMIGGRAVTLIDEGIGTKDYMAPECEFGSTDKPNEKSDVYSIGKILWVLMTGLHPFSREKPAFTNQNLKTIYPHNPDCWHLTRIFEYSIRHNIEDRMDTISFARLCEFFVANIINKYPPLENVRRNCPSCGQGTLYSQLDKYHIPMHMIFSNPMPEGIKGYVCDVCGYICARDNRLLNDYFKKLKDLD